MIIDLVDGHLVLIYVYSSLLIAVNIDVVSIRTTIHGIGLFYQELFLALFFVLLFMSTIRVSFVRPGFREQLVPTPPVLFENNFSNGLLLVTSAL